MSWVRADHIFFSVFWSWFPIGFAGIRTLLLFISAFVTFIIRVAQVHSEYRYFHPGQVQANKIPKVGSRNTSSPAESFVSIIFSSKIPYTFGIYTISAWFYGEIYMWSSSASADLGWTVNTTFEPLPMTENGSNETLAFTGFQG